MNCTKNYLMQVMHHLFSKNTISMKQIYSAFSG